MARHLVDDMVAAEAVVGDQQLRPVLVPEPPATSGPAVAQHRVRDMYHQHNAARVRRPASRHDARAVVAAGEDSLSIRGKADRAVREEKGSLREASRVAGSSVSTHPCAVIQLASSTKRPDSLASSSRFLGMLYTSQEPPPSPSSGSAPPRPQLNNKTGARLGSSSGRGDSCVFYYLHAGKFQL